MTPKIKDNNGVFLGEYCFHTDEMAGCFMWHLSESKEKEIVDWISNISSSDEISDQIFVGHDITYAWLILNKESDKPMTYKIPWGVFTEMMVHSLEEKEFYNDMWIEGDSLYGKKNWTLDYYLLLPTKEQLEGEFKEKFGNNVASIAFFARKHDENNESKAIIKN